MIAQIAVQGLQNRLFDYLVPAEMGEPVAGVRVLVPFGNRTVTGIVIGTSSSSELDASKLKSIKQQLDETPLLPGEVIALWLSSAVRMKSLLPRASQGDRRAGRPTMAEEERKELSQPFSR